MSIIDSLPPENCPERDSMLIEAVADGLGQYNFVPISSEHDGHKATFQVFNDALKIEDVRINVSADTEQKIADILGCLLLTAKLADLIFMQAETTITPKPRPITSSTKAMIEHSKDIDKELNGRTGLVSTVGKHWLIDQTLLPPRIPNMAINYGWHFKGQNFQGIHGDLPVCYQTMPDIRLIQSRGYFHNKFHVDYSQTCVLVARECIIDDQPSTLDKLLNDPALAYLANHDGQLTITSQP